ncbi:MAG TPA: HAMP domain-containing sensor histidine kinase [Candidatus Limnocylindrales bacterium]|nr:HAMP domain-containing sensor histidine kinase [Candidatus Limnocylindrales bacterium]
MTTSDDDAPEGGARPRRADRGAWSPGSGPPPWVVARRRRWASGGNGGPWPPHGRGGFRRFGCLFVLVGLGFAVLFVSGATVVLRLLGHILGRLAGAPGAPTAPLEIDAATTLAVVVFVVAIVALAGTTRRLGGFARTLDDLADAADRVEAGDFGARVAPPVRGPRGLRDLVTGFNAMAARLEADEAQRRSLLADVSHELRTPLSVVQGTLEAILDGVYPADAAHLEPLVDETRVLTRLVDDLRTLALADAGTLELHREPTDLGLLLTEVATAFASTAAERNVTVTATAPDLPLLDIDPVRIRQVLDNVVANAVRHSPAGGTVAIDAHREPGGEVTVEIRDEGPGIPAELHDHVFDRFVKGVESRGSGLGLAIARGLVEAHGGWIEARSGPSGSKPAAGTTIRFRLPGSNG